MLNNGTISYIIYLTNKINKTNINLFSIKYSQVIYDILAAKVYAMAYGLIMKKQHREKYQIIKKKLY